VGLASAASSAASISLGLLPWSPSPRVAIAIGNLAPGLEAVGEEAGLTGGLGAAGGVAAGLGAASAGLGAPGAGFGAGGAAAGFGATGAGRGAGADCGGDAPAVGFCAFGGTFSGSLIVSSRRRATWHRPGGKVDREW
jgi:hypothetical protein